MHIRISIKFFIFFVFFTVFYLIFRSIFQSVGTLAEDMPWLFSSITLMFSIISGFIIQSKWRTWNDLIDATHGEVSSLRHLYMLSNHFSKKVQNKIKKDISIYLKLVIDDSNSASRILTRSDDIERALYKLEETILDLNYKHHPSIGFLAYDLISKTVNYREKRLQGISHKLPFGVNIIIICSLVAVITASILIGKNFNFFEYFLTLLTTSLAFGIFLLIDDLDNPYRPGQWHLKNDEYVKLYKEINKF